METFLEKESTVKHSPKDILVFGVTLACALNLYLYFKFLDSGDKTQIVINANKNLDGSININAEIPVYVSGAVNFPGVYSLKDGSLMVDLVRSAGGFSRTANVMWLSKNLNLSEALKANTRVYIPFGWDTEYVLAATTVNVGEDGDSGPDEGPGDENNEDGDNANLDVNTASLDDLDALEGIGPVFAQKIIDNRPYEDFDDFKANSGLSENLANSLSEHVRFD